MHIVHLTSSTFFGGPERQMLGLARSLPAPYRTTILSFAEGGRCRAFLERARQEGIEAASLRYDTPWIWSAIRELKERLIHDRAAVLCCHGYKANLLGRVAARQAGIPVLAVSRGWTGENWKVRLYEAVDRWHLRFMDRVVCVSEGQAAKVRRAGVPDERVVVIRNAIRAERFARPDPAFRRRLHMMFPRPSKCIVCVSGRLSPEKGLDLLVKAASTIVRDHPNTGFVLFGDGVLRDALRAQINRLGLADRFVLAGFREDFDGFLPFVDVLVQPSYTEGLSNVVLEACAAGVPVVATAVGGTPELVTDGENGYLVPAGDAERLSQRLRDLLASPRLRRVMGARGRQRVLQDFTFEAQSEQYQKLFGEMVNPRRPFAPESQPSYSTSDTACHDRLDIRPTHMSRRFLDLTSFLNETYEGAPDRLDILSRWGGTPNGWGQIIVSHE